MAIAGSDLCCWLLKNGRPYGVLGSTSEWVSGTNVNLYVYQPTFAAGVPSGTLALNTSGATPSQSADANGVCKFELIPAGRYTLILNHLGGNNWGFFPGMADIIHGLPEIAVIRLTGDAVNDTFNLDVSGGDGINTSVKPWQSDIQVWYMGRTLLTENTNFSLTLATSWPWDNSDAAHTNKLTTVLLPNRSGSTTMTADEYLDVYIRYLPGGGY